MGTEVSVDLRGRKNDDGTLMVNASDVVEDLLLYAGILAASIDSTALTAAFNALDRGSDRDGERITSRALSLYLSEARELTDIFDEINFLVGSFLFVDADGKYHYEVFLPTTGEGLTAFDELDILLFEIDEAATFLVDYLHVIAHITFDTVEDGHKVVDFRCRVAT